MNRDNAVIITYNNYPDGDAGALRQHAMAKILQSLGYSLTVLGYGKPTEGSTAEYDGVRYMTIRNYSAKPFKRFYDRVTSINSIMRLLREHFAPLKLIVVVDVLPGLFRLIEKYALQNNCTLIHDSVEWYSPEEFRFGRLDFRYRLKEYTNRRIIRPPWRVVSISSYLDEYFRARGMQSVRVPAILDVVNSPYEHDKINAKTIFVYAGSPVRKDCLREILEGFALLPKKQLLSAELHIIGADIHTLMKVCGVSAAYTAALGVSLVIHGRLPHMEAVKWVRAADYTVLLRNAGLRYAKAGFPTKVVESLTAGTPVICNLSSDLGLYLKEGENALLIGGQTPIDVAQALSRAIGVPAEERDRMNEAARRTAEKYFDYRTYIDSFRSLIDSVDSPQ